MAQIHVPWEIDGIYLIASRIPSSTVDNSEPQFSFFISRSQDGSKGNWTTVDFSLPQPWQRHTIPSETMSAFPWPDHAGRVPHAIALVARDRDRRDSQAVRPLRDGAVFQAALERAFAAGPTSNSRWVLEAFRVLNDARLVICAHSNALQLRDAVRDAAAQPMQGPEIPRIVDVSRFCEQGPGPKDFGPWPSPDPGCNIL